MKNIIDEKPTDKLHGRSLFSTKFVNIGDIKDKTILDIGCGFGWFEVFAVKKGVRKIIGIEISENDLKTAIKYLKNNKIEFVVGSAIKLPFKEKTFDTVVSWEVIEHILKGSERKIFDEVLRVLKSGGSFYLSTPNDSFISNIFDPAWWLIGHRHYNRSFLEKIAKKNGFRVEKVEIKGGFWEIVDINNLYISKWIFRTRPFFKRIINRKQNYSYSNCIGFTNIFMKFRKK